jgi:two-component system, sensor histidine kinase and response regulator
MAPVLHLFTAGDAASLLAYLTLSAALFFLLSELQQESKVRKLRGTLLETERRFRSLFEEAPVAYHETNADGIVTRVNRAECITFGLAPDEIVGRHAWELAAPEQREIVREGIRRRLSGDQPLMTAERVYLRRDGTRVHVEVHENLIEDSEGKAAGIRTALLDITERTRSEETIAGYAEQMRRKNKELSLAAAAAREATELKTRFLANMSHEIRTPINGVLGMTELLLDSRLDPEQREYAETVKSCAGSLLELISDILDLSKLEAGKLVMESVPFAPRTVINDIRALLGVRAAEKGLQMSFCAGNDVPEIVLGDPGRLRQILTNLVGNAIKFTERGSVTVAVERTDEDGESVILRFTVRDTGIGIPREHRHRLFERFVQLDGSNSRKYGGSGLGLTISKELVEMLGGEIGVESEPGRGSIFWFTLAYKKSTMGANSPPAEALTSR